jgi:hypothetical protein
VTVAVVGCGINSRSQNEYDKTSEDNEVHYPGVGIAKKAPVG